jgi:5'-deoxynucleotidase YfbR-like HD superfamily hydrolase
MKKPDIHRLIEFQQLMLRFSVIERATRHPDNFEKHETDTEHSYSLAMAAWFLAQYFPQFDEHTIIKLSLSSMTCLKYTPAIRSPSLMQAC